MHVAYFEQASPILKGKSVRTKAIVSFAGFARFVDNSVSIQSISILNILLCTS